MFETFDLFIDQMRKEVRAIGAEELRTPEEVDHAIETKGTTLVFVNSTCVCADERREIGQDDSSQ